MSSLHREPNYVHRIGRFLGSLFGFRPDSGPLSAGTKIGTKLAWFAYALLIAAQLDLFLTSRLLDLGEGAAHRIAVSAGIVVFVVGLRLVPHMRRQYRAGMLLAWPAFAISAYELRRKSGPADPWTDVGQPECVTVAMRDPPNVIFPDSVALAIRQDPSSMGGVVYMDVMYTTVLQYWLDKRRPPGDSLGDALRVLGLEGELYETFFRRLVRYRFRTIEDEGVMDLWFCGTDQECGTCDDEAAVYHPVWHPRGYPYLPAIRRGLDIQDTAVAGPIAGSQ